MFGMLGQPFGQSMVPSGLQPMPLRSQVEVLGRLPKPIRGAVDWMTGQLEDVAASRALYDEYNQMIPGVRQQLGPTVADLSDDELRAQMMTHDRFGVTPLLPRSEGFVQRDVTQGHDPALAAAEHRAFVQEAVGAAPYGRLGAGLTAGAMRLATPAYAAYKALGLKRGSRPSLAQLVAGIGGAGEAGERYAGPDIVGPAFLPMAMRNVIQGIYGR